MDGVAERLQVLMRRAGIGAQTLSKLTGVPRTAIDNWRDGTVRRPRHWRPLLRIAQVLSLSREEADALLSAAGHPCIGELSRELGPDDPDRTHLSAWLSATAHFQLRAPAFDFVGRSRALVGLLAMLQPVACSGRTACSGGTACSAGSSAAPVAIVRGMGGVGKTELALLAAARLRDSFPDGQLLLGLGATSPHPLTPAQALRQVIHTFHPDAPLGDDLEDLQRRYCRLLNGRAMLIVADDALGSAQVRPLLPPPGNALLVTGRHRFMLPGCLRIDLEPLDLAESIQLLHAACPRLSAAQADAIARACGGLPLALRISGGQLANDPSLRVSEHLAALRDPGTALAALRDPDDPHSDVARCLMLSYTGLDPQTQAVFRRLGVFAADFGTPLAARAIGADAGDALRLLARRSLIRFDAARDRWRLHDLVRDLAVALLTKPPETGAATHAGETGAATHASEAGATGDAGEAGEAMWRYARAALELGQEIARRFGRGDEAGVLSAFDRERPHIDAGWAWALAHEGGERGDRLLLTDLKQVAFLRYDRRTELLPMARRGWEAARRLGDVTAEAGMLNRLGQLHLDLDEVAEAIGCFERQLDLELDGMAQARALNNLGLARIRNGEAHLAVPLYQRQLELVTDARGEAMARCNLGTAYRELHRFPEALSELERARELVQAIGDRYGTGAVLHQLGLVHLHTGQAHTAAALLQQALAVSRELGDRHKEAILLADLESAAARDPAAALENYKTLSPYISPSGSAISSTRAPSGSRK